MSKELHWAIPEDAEVRAAALVVHGLNNHPAVMDPLIAELNKQNIAALRIYLEPTSIGKVTKTALQNHLLESYNALCERFSEVPKLGLGYSFGANLLLIAQHTNREFSLEKLVLFAPAIGLTLQANLIRLLTPLRYLNLSLPSWAPKHVRDKSFTSFHAYQALVETIDELQNLSASSVLKNTKSLVFYSPDDELVSTAKLKSWLSGNELDTWKTIPLEPLGESPHKHLIIDERSLGSKAWQKVAIELNELT